MVGPNPESLRAQGYFFASALAASLKLRFDRQQAEEAQKARELAETLANIVVTDEESDLSQEWRKSEKEKLSEVLGEEVVVPLPPKALLIRKAYLKTKGIEEIEAYYNPNRMFSPNEQIRGVEVGPGDYFWRLIAEGKLPSDAAKLRSAWCIDLDPQGKPHYLDPIKIFEPEYLAEICQGKPYLIYDDETRSSGRIIPSRFGVTPNHIRHALDSEFGLIMKGVGEARRRRYVEFILRGQTHPEWTQNPSLECFEDKLRDCSYLCGGSSSGGGLAHVTSHSANYLSDALTFSPILEFPVKGR